MDQQSEDRRLMELWRKRAMALDIKLGWIRTELRQANHLSLTTEWARGALALLNETEQELDDFLRLCGP